MYTHMYICIYVYIYIYIYTQVRLRRASDFCLVFPLLLRVSCACTKKPVLGCVFGVQVARLRAPKSVHFACQRRLGMQHTHRSLANSSWTRVFGSKLAMQTIFFKSR